MMLHLLTIVLVILKATGFINWSWWLVFAPSIFVVTIALLLIGGGLMVWYIKERK